MLNIFVALTKFSSGQTRGSLLWTQSSVATRIKFMQLLYRRLLIKARVFLSAKNRLATSIKFWCIKIKSMMRFIEENVLVSSQVFVYILEVLPCLKEMFGIYCKFIQDRASVQNSNLIQKWCKENLNFVKELCKPLSLSITVMDFADLGAKCLTPKCGGTQKDHLGMI